MQIVTHESSARHQQLERDVIIAIYVNDDLDQLDISDDLKCHQQLVAKRSTGSLCAA